MCSSTILRRSISRLAAVLLALLPLVCFAGEIGDAKPSPAVDSMMTRPAALEKGFPPFIPPSVSAEQALLDVEYYGFDGELRRGQIVIHRSLAADIRRIFEIIQRERFPVQSVIPVAHERFGWDDHRSMAANNTSGFNYRRAEGSSRWSKHAFGFAIDINPLQNPYIKGEKVLPPGAFYDPSRPGTLTRSSPVVQAFLRMGWTWGGDWKTLKDYQHFQKVPTETNDRNTP